ncbi:MULTISPECIES: GIY-YIG nuclease family protein [Rummeliibacillus]|jgi:putative endonuclease|uniref:GIY-YIG nuclease family protein n=1 Tax=Rummeliibacillus TaxID=648802 RepID=UPI0011B6E79E|nr:MULTISPECIES: GIY-YIG nuclease family protein [Rummeliibacillus]MBO2536717.1 GIY-YIG nuclease family protein [Rummeliibacillus suwonensis]
MAASNNHVMYVLECSDGTYYTGYTNDLEKRIATHNAGKGAKYTKARRPVHCVYFETFENKHDAMSAEYGFKQLTRQQKLHYMATRSETE